MAERHWRHKTFNPPLPAEPPPLSDRLLHAVSALSSEGSPFAVKQFLERTKGDWAARDQRLDKETRAWADAMAPSVHKVAGHLRLPVMSEMLKSFGYEDRQIVPDFRAGFRIQGRIRAANVFGGFSPKRTIPPKPNRQVFTPTPSKNCPASMRPPMIKENQEKVYDSLVEETKGHWMEGPTPRSSLGGPVWDPASKSWRVRNFETFFPALRFLVKQDTSHGADEFRPVDDLTGNGTNGATTLEEAVKLSSLDEFAQLVRVVDAAFPKENGWGDLNMFKIDMRKAYKQCPLFPGDRNQAVVGVTSPSGEVVYFTHNGLPFGASAAPFQFARAANAVVAIAQAIFHLPVQNYLDDFWCVVPANIAWDCFETMKFLFSFLGFKMKDAPGKMVEPCSKGPLLGVEVELRDRDLMLHIDPLRRKLLSEQIQAILDSDFLLPGMAAKLAGKLVFASCAMMGRIGRAFLQPLFRLANLHRTGRAREDAADYLCEGSGRLGGRLKAALHWWLVLLREAPPRAEISQVVRPCVEAWTDAALRPWGLGGVVARSGQLDSTECFGAQLHGRLAKWLPPPNVSTRVIFQLELLAVLLLLQLYGARFRGSALRLWVDNEGARCSIISGYSANSWGARIVAQIWVEVARHDIALWVDRVPTKENPADAPSRDNWELQRRLAWARTPQVEVDDAIVILEEVLDLNPELCFGPAARRAGR